jgi:hypothetical protein
MADAFSYFLPDGTPVSAGANAPLAGTQFYKSESLSPDATSTTTGDVFNAFKGYVSPDGGSFGGGPSADTSAARTAWESLSGVSGDKLGDTSGWDTGKWDAMRKTFGGIANKDKDTTLGALQSDNPFVKETAQRYATESGWLENATPTPNKVNPVPTDPFAAFGADTLPPSDVAPPEPGILSPRINPNAPPPIEEGYRKFTGRTFNPQEGGGGAAPPFSQAAWSGGEMAPTAGSGGRPSMSAGRFGRYAPMGGGASPFAQKYRQRFKPLGAPANGFTPQAGGAGAPPTTQVF